MITKSKQCWEVGAAVKVGFLTLTVRAAIATPGDSLPDAYILTNAAGTKLYRFIPHNGLEAVTVEDARMQVANAEYRAASMAATAIEQIKAASAASAKINAIFAGVTA